MTGGLLLPFALADARGRMSSPRRRDILIGAGVAAALLTAFAFVLFGTGPLHLPATIENVQSKGNWQSIPGFIGTRLGLRQRRASGGVDPRRRCSPPRSLWLVWRVWRGELDWIAARRLGRRGAAGHAPRRCCPGTSRG